MTPPNWKLTGTGPAGSICLLFADWCGIGDDVNALPIVASLAEENDVTVYTPHPELWQRINVTVIGVTITGTELAPNVHLKEFRCSNGEFLDPYWDREHLPLYETIYKLTAWGVWEDNERGGSRRSRFEQLAELLDVDPIEFDYVAALGAHRREAAPYTLVSVESRESFRSLTDEQAEGLISSLQENTVWLSESPGRTKAGSFAELVDLVYNAEHVIGIDNGIMHIACALGKPVTIIGGPTSARSIFEQYGTPLNVLQATHDECISPCYKLPQNGFTNNKCCGYSALPKCLGSVSMDEVVSLAQSDGKPYLNANHKEHYATS